MGGGEAGEGCGEVVEEQGKGWNEEGEAVERKTGEEPRRGGALEGVAGRL